jgi:dUTP pyrophosphatase
MQVKIKKLNELAIIPKYAHPGDSGVDLHSIEEVIIYPGRTALVGTGLSFEIPEGTEIQVRPRSGMSAKTKIRVANSPGTVDSGYRGEVKVILDNVGSNTVTIQRGDRIAQAVLVPVYKMEIEEVKEVSISTRQASGFGSTGGTVANGEG